MFHEDRSDDEHDELVTTERTRFSDSDESGPTDNNTATLAGTMTVTTNNLKGRRVRFSFCDGDQRSKGVPVPRGSYGSIRTTVKPCRSVSPVITKNRIVQQRHTHSPPPRLQDMDNLVTVQGIANMKKSPLRSSLKADSLFRLPLKGCEADEAFMEYTGSLGRGKRRLSERTSLLGRTTQTQERSNWSAGGQKILLFITILFAVTSITGLLAFLAGKNIASRNESADAMEAMGYVPGMPRVKLQEAFFRACTGVAYHYYVNRETLDWTHLRQFALTLTELYRYAGLDGECVDELLAFKNQSSTVLSDGPSLDAWFASLVHAMSCGFDADALFVSSRQRREGMQEFRTGILDGRFPEDLARLISVTDQVLPENFPPSMRDTHLLEQKKQFLLQIWRLVRNYIDSDQKLREPSEQRDDMDVSLYVPFMDKLVGTSYTEMKQCRATMPAFYDNALWTVLHMLAERIYTVQTGAKLQSASTAMEMLVTRFARFVQALIRVKHPEGSLFQSIPSFFDRLENGVEVGPPTTAPLEWLYLAGSDRRVGSRLASVADGKSAVLFTWKLHNAMAALVQKLNNAVSPARIKCSIAETVDIYQNPHYRCGFWPYSARFRYHMPSEQMWRDARENASLVLNHLYEAENDMLRDFWAPMQLRAEYHSTLFSSRKFQGSITNLLAVTKALDQLFLNSGVSASLYQITDSTGNDNAYCL